MNETTITLTFNEDQYKSLQDIAGSLEMDANSLFQHFVQQLTENQDFQDHFKDSLFFHPSNLQHIKDNQAEVQSKAVQMDSINETDWSQEAWQDYLYWEKQDKRTIKRINELLTSIKRDGILQGLGKPEELKGDLAGCYSRRIDECNRLVYTKVNNGISIISCKGHYQ